MKYFFITTALSVTAMFAETPSPEPLVSPDKLKSYIERFNADDRETFAQAIPNAKALEFLSANIPIFECPDKELEQTYYFRWWTFRKHLQQTP